MKKSPFKKYSSLFIALVIILQSFTQISLFPTFAQTVEAWETLTAEEYREWKQSIGETKANELEFAPSMRTATTYAVYQNLFGNQYLEAYVSNDGRFTMGTTGGNPTSTTDSNKKLLFGHPNPWSSFTTIKIDGVNHIFTASAPPIINASGTEAVSIMTVSGVTIKQIITLVNNPSTNRNDVFRISYQMTNNSGSIRSLGTRIMLDTMLGDNDGSPFKVPGLGNVTTEVELVGSDIPQYWQSFDSLTNPNVVSVGTLYRNESEKPDKVQFCSWPNIYDTTWDYFTSGRSLTGDSAVGIYFNPKTCVSGQTRTVSTYYGIGDFAQSDLTPPLSMRVSAPVQMELDAINGEYLSNPFMISVHVQNTGTVTATNVNLSISLPPELALVGGSSTISIGNLGVGAESQVNFSVRAVLQNVAKTVNYNIRIFADNDAGKSMNLSLLLPKVSGTQKLPVIIVPGIFGSTMKSGGSNVGNVQQVYPNLPRQMPANQSDLKVYDNWAIFAGVGDTGYSDLAKHLSDDGYYAYTCPYDWRLSLQDIVANNYLQNIIDQAKRESGQSKVILICHSMGGLVARQYIQSNLYRNDVDTLVMVGTPNNGSAFTYSIFEGGQVVDKDFKLITGATADATANIIINAYSSMVGRTNSITSQEIFNFVYRDKRIPSVYTLGAQYSDLLYWSATGRYTNPLINKVGYESEIARLNQAQLDSYYQPLTGKSAGKVRTAIIYNNDLQTLKTWYAESSSGQGNRYPDGAIQFTHHQGSWFNPFDNEYWQALVMTAIGDKTVLSSSATYGSNGGIRWTEVPLKFGDKGEHGAMVNEVDKLLRNFIFTKDKIKLDATTISDMKSAASRGRTSRAMSIPTNSVVEPYIVINSIGNASVELTLGGLPVGYTDTYGDDQTVISLLEPSFGSYSINFTSLGDLQHIYYTIEYFNGQDVFMSSSEIAVNGSKSIGITVGSDALIAERPNSSLTSGQSVDGFVALTWNSVDNAESYNIYVRDIATDIFTLLDNTNATNFLTNIAWENDATLYFYVEPVLNGGATGILMVSVPNSDYTEADFQVDTVAGNEPLSVSFIDMSRGNITSWFWDFGDGTTSTVQNPTHTYTTNGIFTVTLTVDGLSGTSTSSKPNYIIVGDQLISLDLILDAEATVGDQIGYEVYGNYTSGSSLPVTNGYTIFSSNENIVSVNGNTLMAVGYGTTVINVFYENCVSAQIVNIKDSIVSVSLAETETTVSVGTILENIHLPEIAAITYASGNIDNVPILWYDNTEPMYDAYVTENRQFMLTGILDVASDLLPDESEPLRVSYAINIQTSETPKYELTIIAGTGGRVTIGASGNYTSGAIVNLTATTNNGYRFVNWTTSNGGTFGNANNASTTFTMPSNMTTVTANFEYVGTIGGYIPPYTPPSDNGTNGDSSASNSNTASSGTTSNNTSNIATEKPIVKINGTSIDYTVDAKGNVVLTPTQAQMKKIIENAKNGVLTIDVGSLAGINSISLDFNMSWIPNTIKSIKVFDKNLGSYEISRSTLAKFNGKITLVLKKGSLITDILVDGKSVSVTDYANPMIVSIPYTPKSGELSSQIVMMNKMTGKAIPRSYYKDGYVYATVYSTGHFEPAFVKPKTFTDTVGTWSDESVKYMNLRGVINGMTETTFVPESKITRAQYITMLVRLLDLTGIDYSATEPFSDVDKKDSYYSVIMQAKTLGITNGIGNNQFGRDLTITLEDMYTMTYRAMKQFGMVKDFDKTKGLENYSDGDKVSSYAVEAMQNLLQNGIVKSEGNLNPKVTASRAITALFMYRLLLSEK